MKYKLSKLSSSFFLLLTLALTIMGGCKKDTNEEKEWEWSDTMDGYIVGTFICNEKDADGVTTGDRTKRAFCVLLENNENANSEKRMDFYAFNISGDLFNFPEEMPPYNTYTCGPYFFPDNLKNEWKIKFKYRAPEENEKVYFGCGPCSFDDIWFYWKDYTQIIVTDVQKNN